MKLVLLYIVNIFIVGLFLYSKLLSHKDKLNRKYKGVFNFFNNIFKPVLKILQRFIKPFHVGQGLAVDMTQIILLLIFLTIANLI